MSTNKTENLNLHAWTPDDPVKMSEFNENFAALDAACGGMPHVVWGSYAGTGTCGQNNPTTLTFDFEPKLLLVTPTSYGYTMSRILAPRGCTYVRNSFGTSSNDEYTTRLRWDGNSVSYWSSNAGGQFNSLSNTYYYVAVG